MRLLLRGILRRPSRGQPAQLDVDVSAAARGTVLTGHADERSVEERTFSCQVEQAWLVRFATDLKQSDGTFGIATLWCRGGQGKALLVERAA